MRAIVYIDGTIEGIDADGKPLGAAGLAAGWYVATVGQIDLTSLSGPHDSAGDAAVQLIDEDDQP